MVICKSSIKGTPWLRPSHYIAMASFDLLLQDYVTNVNMLLSVLMMANKVMISQLATHLSS